VSSEIVKWDWDWNGDGVYDLEGGTSVEEHVYDSEFDGLVQLRVTDKDGLIANYSVPVTIGAAPEPTTIPADSLTVSGSGSEATLVWEASVTPSKAWGITVNGVPVGTVDAEARKVTVGDLNRTETVEFGVAPISAEDEVGTSRVAYLDPPVVEPTPTPTPTPTATSTPTPTPSVTPTPSASTASLSLSAATVEPGGTLTVSGKGFVASVPVDIWLHSTPVLLGQTNVSASGSFAKQVTIPSTTTPGMHEVVVSTSNGDVTVNLEVRTASAAALGATGGTFSPWWVVG
jgi:hypothetical protein